MFTLTARTFVVVFLVLLTACSQPAADTGGDEAQTSPPPTLAPAAAPDLPNIVVFMTDDMHLGQMRAIPGIQRELFDQGMTFTQSLVNLPSCCPSRATFLTGQHAINHGVLTNGGVSGGFSSFENQEATLPVALGHEGYATIFVGKYLNGFGIRENVRYTPPGWSDFRGLVTPSEVFYRSPTFWVNGELEGYGDDVFTVDVVHEMAISAIVNVDNDKHPLFMTVSYSAPHAQAGAPFDNAGLLAAQIDADTLTDEKFLRPPLSPLQDVGTFADEELPSYASFNEADIEDKPKILVRRVRSEEELEPVRQFHRATLDSLVSVDRSVVRLMEHIDQTSDRDTWYIFTSDNGLLLGQHRQFGVKYYPYEETVRVPLAIKGPGVRAGATTPQLVSNVDLAPTIVDLAGATPPRPPDGMSLEPLLTGQEEPSGRAVLLQGFQFRPLSPPYRGVHTGDSVYIEWLPGERELYDLVADPYQLDNLAGLPEARELETRNEALLRELEGCGGPECARIGADLPAPDHPRRTE